MSEAATVGASGEPALLALVRARFGGPAPAFVHLGIGDDAAVIAAERNAVEVLTADTLVEGVHFDRALMSPADIGRRAMAVNLSDLAAMGATPRAALVSLGVPEALPLADFEGILDGLATLAATHRTAIVGGNLTRTTGPLFIDVTAVGAVHARKVLRRAGARPGDVLFVSGRVGAAAAGLAWLRRGLGEEAGPDVQAAVERFRAPAPRVRLGQLVGRSKAASACMDLSDGLADAVTQMAAASGVGAEIDLDAVPVDAAVGALGLPADAAARLALGSDDYELLFAVPRRRQKALRAAAALARVPVTRIGELRKAPGVVATSVHGPAGAWPAGYMHFAP